MRSEEMTIETNVNNFPDDDEEEDKLISRQDKLQDFFKYRGTVPIQ